MVKILFLSFEYLLYFSYKNTLITLDAIIFIIGQYKLTSDINNYKQFRFIILYILDIF